MSKIRDRIMKDINHFCFKTHDDNCCSLKDGKLCAFHLTADRCWASKIEKLLYPHS